MDIDKDLLYWSIVNDFNDQVRRAHWYHYHQRNGALRSQGASDSEIGIKIRTLKFLRLASKAIDKVHRACYTMYTVN